MTVYITFYEQIFPILVTPTLFDLQIVQQAAHKTQRLWDAEHGNIGMLTLMLMPSRKIAWKDSGASKQDFQLIQFTYLVGNANIK